MGQFNPAYLLVIHEGTIAACVVDQDEFRSLRFNEKVMAGNDRVRGNAIAALMAAEHPPRGSQPNKIAGVWSGNGSQAGHESSSPHSRGKGRATLLRR